MADADTLNMLVTGAIWRAEQLQAQGIRANEAWAEVSSWEEQLACLFPQTDPEGRIARRGAVRAALKSGDPERAEALADRYLAEKGTSKEFKAGLREILDDATQALANHFPYAAKRYGVRAAQGFARQIKTSGAFGLAA